MKTATAVTVMTLTLVMLQPMAGAGATPERDDLWDLVGDLERRAFKAYDRVESKRHQLRPGEQGAVRAFYELGMAASRYRTRLERVGWNPHRAGPEFDALSDAYYRAAGWMRVRRVENRVRKDFRRVARTMDELAYIYGVTAVGRDRGRVYRYDRRDDRARGRVRVVPPRRPRVRFDVGVRVPWGRIRVSG